MKSLLIHNSIVITGALAVLLSGLLLSMHQAHAATDESVVKTAYIYRFMKFVEWPPRHLAQNYNVCVHGTNPFGSILDSLKGKEVGGRPIQVITDVPLSQARYCHVVFVSRSESGRLSNALLKLRQAPILTISDIEGFADHGGVIELIPGSEGEINFRISQKSAQDVGLRVNSKLLSLSK